MLIPENSFNLIVTDVKGIKSVFELVQALKEDKIRLTLLGLVRIQTFLPIKD